MGRRVQSERNDRAVRQRFHPGENKIVPELEAIRDMKAPKDARSRSETTRRVHKTLFRPERSEYHSK
jgi:hypothetical protein